MSEKTKKQLRWVRLDNAAKIYPAARRRNWSSLFRQSVTLCEEVDKTVLKSALDVTVKRFPTIAARLRKGAFWYYLEQIELSPELTEEKSFPLSFMDKRELRKCAFRVIAYKNRIAVEYFHSLTDGTGALIFLKSLTAEYLEQKYNISIPCEMGVLDRREQPHPDELEDSFPKHAGRVPISRKETSSWQLSGEIEENGFLNLTCFKLEVEQLRELALNYGATLTVFMSAVIMQALLELQKEKIPNEKKRKLIKILIPINLRNLFPSKTLRNFAMYTLPELDPRLGEYDFQEICSVIKHKMGAEFTQKHMSRVIATNVNDELNPAVRLIPLPLKNLVMKAVFDTVGIKTSCLDVSNLGNASFPEAMRKYITRVDFILGAKAASPYNCGIISYNGTMYVNVVRNTVEPELERHIFKILQGMGVRVEVESNKSSRKEE